MRKESIRPIILFVTILVITCITVLVGRSMAQTSILPVNPPNDPSEYTEWKKNLASQGQNRFSIMSVSNNAASNDYVEYAVKSNGRFTIGTTGGDPENYNDDYKKLLYGHPNPSTSFTTIKVDDQASVFTPNVQSPTAGNDGVSNISEENLEQVSIKQELKIIKNNTTQRQDVIQIKYIVTNRDFTPHSVGVRIMMDTMLGSNDGAPFRVPGVGYVTNEVELTGDSIPEYWQAFDSLLQPNVISQGTLMKSLRDRPDKVQFAYWGNIKDTNWDYTIDPNRSITRDSAIGIYWNSKALAPGETREYTTYYGLSEYSTDLTSHLSLSVTGASSMDVEATSDGYTPNPFTVTSYIRNNDSTPATNVKTKINLPEGLRLVSGDQQELNVGTIESGREVVASWRVQIDLASERRDLDYSVSVSADNLETKNVARHLTVPAYDGVRTGTQGALNNGYYLVNGPRNQLTFVGEPIDAATGAHVLEHTYLSVNAADLLAFKLMYNSMLLDKGPMGNGWSHNFETRLEQLPNGDINIHWSASRRNGFFFRGNNQYTSSEQATLYDNLVKNEDGSYTLTRKDQSVFNFDSSGKLTSANNGHGQSLVLEYDYSGRLQKVVEPVSGQYLSFGYNTAGQVSEVSDKLARKVKFNYDGQGNLTGITDAGGQTTLYTYDSQGRILQGTDATGKQIFSNTYDEYGRIVAQDDSVVGNQLTRLSYDEVSAPGMIITSVTDRNGQKRILTHDNKYRLVSVKDELGNTTSFTYDANGNQTSVKNSSGNTTLYTYDSRGNLLSVTDPAGKVTTLAYDSANNLQSIKNATGQTVVYTYDANNNIVSQTDPLGKKTMFSYDGNGLLLSKTTPGGGKSTYTYQSGMLKTVTNPTGGMSTLDYDAVGRLIKLTDGDGKATKFSYDSRDNLIQTIDPIGNSTKFTYDANNNKLTQTDAKGNITRYQYNGNARLTKIVDALNNETSQEYDGEDRMVRTIDALGNTTEYTYDAKGRVKSLKDATGKTTSILYDSLDNVIGQLDSMGARILTITYDALNNPITVKDALGNTVKNHYDSLGRLDQIVNPLGRVTKLSYDKLDRLSGSIDALGKQSSQTFDSDGNLAILIDPNGNQTKFSYDKSGRLQTTTSAAGNVTKYTYNARDLLSQVTNARGQITNYKYDDAGRLTSYTDPTGTVNFTYDANGNVLTVKDSAGTITREYDKLNRVIKYIDVKGNIIQYTYDKVGNLTTLTYPGGKKVSYAYDSANRLKTVTDWASRVTSYSYDTNGRLVKANRPDGTTETRTYNSASQLLELKDLDKSGNIISKYTYTYDSAGNLIKEQSPNEVESFIVPDAAFTYAADNRIATYNGNPVNYDADGNMISGPLNGAMGKYTYDSRNRLVSVDGVSYTYDAENSRIGVKSGLNQTSYVVDTNAVLSRTLIKTNPQGDKTFYVYGLGLIGQEEAGVYKTYHFDRRGNTIGLTDTKGKVTDRLEYDPYGRVLKHSGNTNTPFTYDGRDGVLDDGNGLYYSRARYYNPEIKRFVNSDVVLGSVVNSKSLNRYAYVQGSPTNRIDPSGYWLGIDDAIASGAGAVKGLAGKYVGDVIGNVIEGRTGHWGLDALKPNSDWEEYTGAALGGAAEGETLLYTLNPWVAGAAGSLVENSSSQGLKLLTGKQDTFDVEELTTEVGKGLVMTSVGKFVPELKIKGINAGRGNWSSVLSAQTTKLGKGTIKRISSSVIIKGISADVIGDFPENIVKGYGDELFDILQHDTAQALNGCSR